MTKKTALFLTPKMGLIPEVSAQNYETLAKALREYVSNAMDAKAKKVWITFSANPKGATQLDIRDSGKGMTLDELRDQFLAVGGSRKYDDPATVGRIGIGFLAVVPFCDTITIHTKSSSAPRVVRAIIDTNTMLPAGVRFEEIATQSIGTAEELSDSESKRLCSAWGDSFTSFSLTDLRGDIVDTFADDEAFARFREELRLILPLPWPDDAPLKEHLTAPLWAALTKKARTHSLQVYLNDATEPLTRRIYGENIEQENVLYCQEFLDTIIVAPNAELGQAEPIRVTGFFVCNEPVPAAREGTKLTGIVTRVLNVAVDEHTYFNLEGREERKKRVAGEVFLDGLDANRAMQINRNAFTETHRPVAVFRYEMALRLIAFFTGINRVWRARSDVNKAIKRVRGIVDGVSTALATISNSGRPLVSKRVARDADALMRHRRHRLFRIETTSGLEVRASNAVAPSGRTPYRIELSGNPQDELNGVVEVSHELLDIRAKTYEIGGVTFGLEIVSGTIAEPPCAINVAKRFIVLNDIHPLIAAGDQSVIEMVVYLAYCVDNADSPSDLQKQLLLLLTIARQPRQSKH